MSDFVWIPDLLFFIPAAVYAAYLLFFCLAAHTYQRKKARTNEEEAVTYRKIAVLIPAYAEDGVIFEAVESFLGQNYPRDKYTICIISDHMRDDTNTRLKALPVTLAVARFPEGSTKVKALNLGMSLLADHDVAVVMDADNTVLPDFLYHMNLAFERGARVVQAHRTAKSTETPFQVLDALSEEINNTIFRLGHAQVGLSAALIGSGMAFEYSRFKSILGGLRSVGGFDKELEHIYLRDRMRFYYLQDTPVFDEKIRKPDAFATQRKRWLSAQWVYFKRFAPEIPAAIRTGNIDFLDKILQTAMPPRVLFPGAVLFFALLATFLVPSLSCKWWALLGGIISTYFLCIPRSLWNRKLIGAIWYVGHAFWLMFLNLFRLKGANRKFIHTKHGD